MIQSLNYDQKQYFFFIYDKFTMNVFFFTDILGSHYLSYLQQQKNLLSACLVSQYNLRKNLMGNLKNNE